MENILEINDKNLGHNTILFLVTSHFLEKVRDRSLIKRHNVDKWVENAIRESVVVDSRPSTVINIINHHFYKSLYLYNKSQKVVFVLEQNHLTREFNILKTSYTALESDWMEKWLSSTQKSKRKKFVDDYQGYDISLNYTPNAACIRDTLDKELSSMVLVEQNKQKPCSEEKLKEAVNILANNKVVSEIVTKLKEENPIAIKTISVILEKIGHNKTLEILNETLRIESQGGMLLKDNKQRRTPGGVFFSLAKEKISKDVYNEIHKEVNA